MNAARTADAIEVRGLHKTYRWVQGGRKKSTPVLDGISLSLSAGQFVSLVGPSGGGKSTLLNLLAGLEAPDAGEVRIHGRRPIPGGGIAYMQQNDLLLPWRTLWDNILLAPEINSRAHRREMEPKAEEMVRQFGLEGFEHHFPGQLSGGMRQRAALIRTLLGGREILLLDEPFGALDAITRRRLQGLLLKVWRNFRKTVLLVTHDVEEALLLSERVVVLSARPGRIVREIPVAVPHRGREGSPEILRLKVEVLNLLEHDLEGEDE